MVEGVEHQVEGDGGCEKNQGSEGHGQVQSQKVQIDLFGDGASDDDAVEEV